MKQKRRFKRTTITIVGLAAFLLGLGAARVWPSLTLMWVLIAGVTLLIGSRKKDATTLISVLAFGFLLGWWRGGIFLTQLEPYRQLSGKQVFFVAQVQSDATYDDQGQLAFDVEDIYFLDPKITAAPGRISVKGHGEVAIYRGDIIEVSGRLQPTRGSRQARISFSNFKVSARNQTVVEHLRRRFVAGVGNALPEPSASFGLGLLIGYRTSLPEITQEQLKITGLTHIIAVSGYNLTIIIRAVRRGLAARSKYQQLVVCIGLILSFLLITDFSASIVRASIVSMLSLLAWYYGRRFRPLLILTLTAAITAGWNPLYLWSDIGWYLSFLAFFGILIIAPLLSAYIKEKTGRESQITQLLLETSSAQLMTAPLILMIFSRISVISLVSNLIIAPLVPLAMLATMASGIIGILSPILSGFIAWPARMLLRYMLDMVQVLSNVPYAFIESSISVPAMIACYVCIASMIVTVRLRIKRKYGIITDKNTIV